MPRDEKKKRKSEGKERRAASKKPKGKRLQITEIEIQQAKKKDLERFQKLYPKIFKRISLDGGDNLQVLRTKFIVKRAIYVRENNLSDDDSDVDENDDDDDEDEEEEDEDEDSEEEDSSDSEDSTRSKKSTTKKKTPEKNLSRRTPPRSGGGAVMKSPSVADRRAAFALVYPTDRVPKSAQQFAKIYKRSGQENLTSVGCSRIAVGDLVAVPNSDFSRAPDSMEMDEVTLFTSYTVYFFRVLKVTSDCKSVILKYVGRIEPLDPTTTPTFRTSLNLDYIPRDRWECSCDPSGRLVVATTKGKNHLKSVFTKDSSSSSGGSGGGKSSDSSRGHRRSKEDNSDGSNRDGHDDGGDRARDRSSFGGGSSRERNRSSGNISVSFSMYDDDTFRTEMEDVELPFLGPATPPLVAAKETIFWRPSGSLKAVSGTNSFNPQHQPMVCTQTEAEFVLINAARVDTKEATEIQRKFADSVILRNLVNPVKVTVFITGKGLDLKHLTEVKTLFANQAISVRNGQDAFISPEKNPGTWDQLRFDVHVYNTISSSTVLQDHTTYEKFLKFGFVKNMGNEWELDSTSVRLSDLIATSLNFLPEQTVSSSHELSGQKVILGMAIQQVELVHSLLRNPAVFVDAFVPIVAALNDPTHEVCKDVYSVPALTWFFELCLADFYRRIRYHQGAPNAVAFRRLLWKVVVYPFLNLTQQVQISFNLAAQTKQMMKIEAMQKKEKKHVSAGKLAGTSDTLLGKQQEATAPVNSAAPVNSGGSRTSTPPSNRKVCKYYLASFLQVPFPGTDKIPVCTFADDPMNCPTCPHQDFSTWSKADLTQLITGSKGDFSSQSWSRLYPSMVAAIDKLA